jgi:hypothetical protein
MTGRLMNDEFETMWIEDVVACLEVLFGHLPGRTERISNNLSENGPCSSRDYETGSSQCMSEHYRLRICSVELHLRVKYHSTAWKVLPAACFFSQQLISPLNDTIDKRKAVAAALMLLFLLLLLLLLLYFRILLHLCITRSPTSVSNATKIVHNVSFILKSH